MIFPHVFIDSLYKIVPFTTDEEAEAFLDWLNQFSEENHISFTIMITGELEKASEGVKKYI